MKKGIWKNQEVKELFTEVEKAKLANKPLKEAFILHAQKYNRKPNSVRNYYYHEIDNLFEDEKRKNKLGINLDRHEKSSIQYFSQEEEDVLMKKIDGMAKQGVSVRKACLTLSNGDVGVMLRYQNKYRNYLAKKKPKVKDNIIKFEKKKSGLSEGEIQALFMGLVRLVKRNAMEEGGAKLKSEFDNATNELRKVIVKLNNREKDYEELKDQFLKIKKENDKLVSDMIKLKCSKAEKLKEKLNLNKKVGFVEIAPTL